MRLVLAFCVLFASCATTGVERPVSFFDAPVTGFTIPADGENGWTMERLVLEYGRATNQRFLFDPMTLAMLHQTNVPLDTELVVPPIAVHSVVESILVETGFRLAVQRKAEPRLVTVDYGRGGSLLEIPQVNHADLELWRDHPAYLVGTFITLDACDTRVISNSLRATLTDANLQQIIPLGTSGALLVQGPGPWVCEFTEMLLDVNERERELQARLDPGE